MILFMSNREPDLYFIDKLALYVNDLKSLNIDFSKIIDLAKIEHHGNTNILILLNNLEKDK